LIAVANSGNHTRTFQSGQMLGYGGLRKLKTLIKGSDIAAAILEPINNLQAFGWAIALSKSDDFS
jgi:hypothetical protein